MKQRQLLAGIQLARACCTVWRELWKFHPSLSPKKRTIIAFVDANACPTDIIARNYPPVDTIRYLILGPTILLSWKLVQWHIVRYAPGQKSPFVERVDIRHWAGQRMLPYWLELPQIQFVRQGGALRWWSGKPNCNGGERSWSTAEIAEVWWFRPNQHL